MDMLELAQRYEATIRSLPDVPDDTGCVIRIDELRAIIKAIREWDAFRLIIRDIAVESLPK